MSRCYSLRTRSCWRAAGIAVALAVAVVTSFVGFSAGYAQPPEPVEQVVIPLNKSVTFELPKPFSSAVVGQPDIADAKPLTDRTLYIQAKRIGTTNISVYDESLRLIKVIDVDVEIDVRPLQSRIRGATGNSGITVRTENGQLVLGGFASDAVAADRAYNLARTWGAGLGGPGGGGLSVVNAMTIASPQQVMLKVRFLEVDRNAGRQLGINWAATNASGTRGVTTGLGGLTTSPPQIGGTAAGTVTCAPNGICPPFGNGIFQTIGTLIGAAGGVSPAPFGTILAEIVNNGVKIDTLITALETKGLVQTLAQPNLVALSGDSANFQAGGSIPVPTAVTSGLGVANPTITYEPFGVLLNFRPTVLNNGLINVTINPSVSDLDFAHAVTISGTIIPALTVRSATTTVELRDGQSFAIAGLLEAHNDRNISQLPWLGDVPVLGALFRSAAYQKDETDLVIIVTPSLVQPAPPGARLATPFDTTVPSNDVDFFLFGQTELKKKYTDYVAGGGDIQGPYGYMLGIMQGPGSFAAHK